MLSLTDTIVAIATPPGEGAIGIIRLSGTEAIAIAAQLFAGKNLDTMPSHTVRFGRITDGAEVIDEVVLSLFRCPASYTGEDVVEISCHGSGYILRRVVERCTRHGARPAQPGEFTMRAFLNGKLDLTQAEAVADLIASQAAGAHRAAMHNLRGGFSHDLAQMRDELISFSALIELELDFSQEDVEFADRTRLGALVTHIAAVTDALIRSFSLGNALKNGVSVAIIGNPNAGKSTLLNALLNEERAIVSDIPGTTRDTIEETLNIHGILFRLIDTAGIRSHSQDTIELKGMERSRDAMRRADIVIYLYDLTDTAGPYSLNLADARPDQPDSKYLMAGNKLDEASATAIAAFTKAHPGALLLSARNGQHINTLKDALYQLATGGTVNTEATIITNARHLHALQQVREALADIQAGLATHLPGDLISLDIRRSLHYLGEITGAITTEDKLDYIFSKFCIGK